MPNYPMACTWKVLYQKEKEKSLLILPNRDLSCGIYKIKEGHMIGEIYKNFSTKTYNSLVLLSAKCLPDQELPAHWKV